jgi:hypothetical protein
MRTTLLSTLLLASVFSGGGSVRSQHLPESPQLPASSFSGDAHLPSWHVTGSWQGSASEAKQAALREGRQLVEAFLREQGLHPAHVITEANFERKCRIKNYSEEKRDFTSRDPALGVMYQTTCDIELPSKVLQDLRAGERMLLLLKLTGGILLLLGIVVAYFRLEEATKGYYSGWLRLAAAASGSAVVAAVFLMLA